MVDVFPRDLNKLWNKRVLRIYLAFQMARSAISNKYVKTEKVTKEYISIGSKIESGHEITVRNDILNKVEYSTHVSKAIQCSIMPKLVIRAILEELRSGVVVKWKDVWITKDGTYKIDLKSDKEYNVVEFEILPVGFSRKFTFSKKSNHFVAVIDIKNLKKVRINSVMCRVSYDINLKIYEYKPLE